MISATQLRPGMIIKFNNELYSVFSMTHRTPGNCLCSSPRFCVCAYLRFSPVALGFTMSCMRRCTSLLARCTFMIG